MSDEKKLYNYDEAAAILRIHPCSLRRLVSQKKIDYIKVGNSVRFSWEMIVGSNIRKAG